MKRVQEIKKPLTKAVFNVLVEMIGSIFDVFLHNVSHHATTFYTYIKALFAFYSLWGCVV